MRIARRRRRATRVTYSRSGAKPPSRRVRRCGATVACALFVASCASEPQAVRQPAVVIDERAGTVDGAGFGDTPAEIKAQLGGSWKEGDIESFPDGRGFTGRSIRYPDGAGSISTLRFEGRSFWFTRSAGAFGVFVWSTRARTRGGVGVGDRLEKVRERYKYVTCDTEVIEDGPEEVSSCLARVGKMRLTFSKDPIAGITVATLLPPETI